MNFNSDCRDAHSMPWFYCDQCGDTVKKPKIPQHISQCGGWHYTCIDCSASFDGNRCAISSPPS